MHHCTTLFAFTFTFTTLISRTLLASLTACMHGTLAEAAHLCLAMLPMQLKMLRAEQLGYMRMQFSQT